MTQPKRRTAVEENAVRPFRIDVPDEALVDLRRRFFPNKVLAAAAADAPPLLEPLLAGKDPAAKEPTLYICEGFACQAPVRGETAIAVGVEPARDGLAMNAQVGSNILARPSPVGHPDDLKPIAEASVSGGAEAGVEAFGLGWWQVNADHGAIPSKRAVVPSS